MRRSEAEIFSVFGRSDVFYLRNKKTSDGTVSVAVNGQSAVCVSVCVCVCKRVSALERERESERDRQANWKGKRMGQTQKPIKGVGGEGGGGIRGREFKTHRAKFEE